jgi:hypothetical protein
MELHHGGWEWRVGGPAIPAGEASRFTRWGTCSKPTMCAHLKWARELQQGPQVVAFGLQAGMTLADAAAMIASKVTLNQQLKGFPSAALAKLQAFISAAPVAVKNNEAQGANERSKAVAGRQADSDSARQEGPVPLPPLAKVSRPPASRGMDVPSPKRQRTEEEEYKGIDYARKRTREPFSFHRTKLDDTPQAIALELGIDLGGFLEVNCEHYGLLRATTKLKQDTYMIYKKGVMWTEGTVVQDRKYLAERGHWRVRYDGHPERVVFDKSSEQVREATWQWQIMHEKWVTSGPYVNSKAINSLGTPGTIVGRTPDSERGQKLWKFHHDDFDGA